MDTDNITQFQSRHELHRHFVDVDGPYRKRLTRPEQALIIAIYLASITLALVVIGYGYDVMKPDEWRSIAELFWAAR